jgi:DNA gyrase subunit A
MVITRGGIMIRIGLDEVSEQGRNTQGVRIINLNEGDRVASIAKISREELSREELSRADAAAASAAARGPIAVVDEYEDDAADIDEDVAVDEDASLDDDVAPDEEE